MLREALSRGAARAVFVESDPSSIDAIRRNLDATGLAGNAEVVQRRVVQQDSFYLSGQPAPAFLLTALGQTQGNKTYDFEHYFFRQNSAQYVLALGYATSAFTTPTAAVYSAETAIPLASTAAREVATGGLSAWPNPVGRSQSLSFSLANAAPGQPLRLTLRDITGRAARQ